MPAEIIPIAEGGHGHYTWNGSNAIRNVYRIRRGAALIARVELTDDVPFHAEILERICHALDDQEHEASSAL